MGGVIEYCIAGDARGEGWEVEVSGAGTIWVCGWPVASRTQ